MSDLHPDNWFQVPDGLKEIDPVVKHLLEQRKQAAKALRDSDKLLRDYVMRNAAEAPEELLPTLSPLQSDALDFIVDCFKHTGQSPTGAEIQDHMGWNNLTSAANAVNALVRKGYVHRTKGRWRSLVPLFNSKRQRVKKKK